jgi:N-acetylmuramoyl-L-alanine amidase
VRNTITTRRRLLALGALSLAALVAPKAAEPKVAKAAGWRVGLQAGHWLAAEMPDEMSRLRVQTGTYGGGWDEWELALDVAERAALRLQREGIEVDVLPATIPPGYKADAFVALHADGDATGRFSGYKLARASRSQIPDVDNRFVEILTETYGAATGLPLDDRVSRGMLGYYAFASHRFRHAIAPRTPAVILEMGFMTNAHDLSVLLGDRESVAAGISRGVYKFLEETRG